MPSIDHSDSRQRYWRSMEELAETPAVKPIVDAHDMPAAPDQFSGTDDGPGVSRRGFLKLMGASIALAGLTACRWPQEKIAPFASRPADRIPGVPVHYATAYELHGVAAGLLVTSFDGRPTKIEGNPLHPANGNPERIAARIKKLGRDEHPLNYGAATTIQQSIVLQLYDPDRSKRVVENLRGGEAAAKTHTDGLAAFTRFWNGYFNEKKEAVEGHGAALRKANGAKLAVVAEASSSVTLQALRQQFRQLYPNAMWAEYEPLSRDSEREGAKLAFGEALRSVYHLAHAERIVAIDSDLLDHHPAALRHAHDFAIGRRRVDADDVNADPVANTGKGGHMNRLYAIESTFSSAGIAADHRYPVAATVIPHVVAALAREIFVTRGVAVPEGGADAVKAALDKAKGAEFIGIDATVIAAIAEDLIAHKGHSVVAVGPRQAPNVHALAHLINAALGNVGANKPVTLVREPHSSYPEILDRPTHADAIVALAKAIGEGQIDTVIVLGGNPAFTAPVDAKFGEALAKATHVIHLGLYRDETAQFSTWHIPQAHALESWGDGRAWDGTLTAQQPLIEPLYDGKSVIEFLATINGETGVRGYNLVRHALAEVDGLGAGDHKLNERAWEVFLHDGVLTGSAFGAVEAGVKTAAVVEGINAINAAESKPAAGDFELIFTTDGRVYDGRFLNLGWNVEVPEVVTSLTWDNVALIGPETAEALQIKTGENVTLTVGDYTADVPAFVQPGLAANSVVVWVGYGRTHAGRVGNEVGGVDMFKLRASSTMHVARGLKLTPARGSVKLALAQKSIQLKPTEFGERDAQERVKNQFREITLDEYSHHPDAVQHLGPHIPPLHSMWEEHSYPGYKWGMTIDLNTCIGCNACVVACQSENNIPTVGKSEILRGREMHWLRTDRYFKGDAKAPSAITAPVPCMQCENAPCEQVCPVAATVHDHEGLNVMIYNRCIGTRYCLNNCPWKVRRFNYFWNHADLTAVEQMRFNPEVTVRSRGVMEKCSYCVQRIMKAKIDAKREKRSVVDGEIKTACQQTCPTHSIIFGDLNDPTAVVTRLYSANQRSYAQLAELNAKPRTQYLARIRNVNPKLKSEAEQHADGHVTSHEHSH